VDAARHRRGGIAPFLLVNPRSGDDNPSPDELKTEAERRGVEARVLAENDDAATLARAAADRGADAIGMAGGDGSLGAVAEVAVERELPLVCVPFGTRNHFARDLGVDPDDPIGALDAFAGQERRVDVGAVGGRLFVNNVSLGIYAGFVHDPDRKTRNRLVAFLRMAPAALGRSVANNDYRITSMADLGERSRLDEGLLHVYVIEAVSRRALLALLARAVMGIPESGPGWVERAAPRLRIDFARPRIHAAIDGEPTLLEPPLDFEIWHRRLRVLIPPPSGEGGTEFGSKQ
jgi:diacylglycerol kinase family enzyme